MSNPNIMSDSEIHEFGINIVLDDIRKNGFTITSVATDRDLNPQITAKINGQVCYILVRTACYPNKGRIESREIGTKMILEAKKNDARCYYTSIGIANSDGTTDLEMATPIRGASFYVAYNGLEILTFEKLFADLSTSEVTTFNQYGEFAGSVVREADGRHSLKVGNQADASAALMSICLIFANDLNSNQRILFSKWADLPINAWTPTHQQKFAQALIHYFMEAKVSGGNLPPSILKSLQSFPPQALPQLQYPLTHEIKAMFSSLFGG